MKPKRLQRVIPFALLAFMVILMTACTTVRETVDPGEVGILIDYQSGTKDGKPSMTTVAPGTWVTVNTRYQVLAQYPSAAQNLVMVRSANEGQVKGDDSTQCNDKNGVPIFVDSTTTWRVNPKEAGDLYMLYPGVPLSGKFNGDLNSTLVRGMVRSAIATVCGKYTYDDLLQYQARVDFTNLTTVLIQKDFATSHLLLDGFFLREIYPNDTLAKAIAERTSAQQAAQTAVYDKQKAEAVAAANVAKAQGDAQVNKIAADSQAYAIQKITELQNLPEYTAYLQAKAFADKWDGKLSMVSGQGNTGTLIQLPVSGDSGSSVAAQPTAVPTAAPKPTAKPSQPEPTPTGSH